MSAHDPTRANQRNLSRTGRFVSYCSSIHVRLGLPGERRALAHCRAGCPVSGGQHLLLSVRAFLHLCSPVAVDIRFHQVLRETTRCTSQSTSPQGGACDCIPDIHAAISLLPSGSMASLANQEPPAPADSAAEPASPPAAPSDVQPRLTVHVASDITDSSVSVQGPSTKTTGRRVSYAVDATPSPDGVQADQVLHASSSQSIEQPLLSKASTSRTFGSLASLEVDYDQLDGDDADLALGRLPALLLYGPFGAARAQEPGEARNRALRKLNAVIREHGLGELSFHDYVRALRIFCSLIRRKARAKTRKRASRLRERRELQQAAGEAGETDGSQSFAPLQSGQTHSPGFEGEPERGRRNRVEGSRSAESSPPRARRSLEIDQSPSFASLSSNHRATSAQFSRSRLAALTSLASKPMPARGNSHPESHEPHLNASRVHSVEHPDCPSCPNLRSQPENNISVEHLQLLHHMLRHAESIYGLPLNVRSAPGTSFLSVTDKNIVIQRTGIEADGLLAAQFTSDAFLPAYYVAVDKRVRAIVICVRGTANFLDSLTDVAATHDPFTVIAGEVFDKAARDSKARNDVSTEEVCRTSVGENNAMEENVIHGHGHAGVLRSARQLFERIHPVVLKGVRDHPTYDILITGHSLGGAVSAVSSHVCATFFALCWRE